MLLILTTSISTRSSTVSSDIRQIGRIRRFISARPTAFIPPAGQDAVTTPRTPASGSEAELAAGDRSAATLKGGMRCAVPPYATWHGVSGLEKGASILRKEKQIIARPSALN
jgi:hypothetical protein